MAQTAGSERRSQIRERYWKVYSAWDGTGSGWFKSPRTLPLILTLLSSKKLTDGRDVSRVYLELLSRHLDGGVIEIGNESDHAYASGYTGTRAVRTWHERMQILKHLGFIKSVHVGNQRYRLVLLVDPLVAIAELRKKGSVDESWWEAYSLRLMETKEADAERFERIVGSSTTKESSGTSRKKSAA